MKEKVLIALGYPLGFALLNEEVEVYNIALNELVYPVTVLPSYVWLTVLEEMSSRTEVLEKMNSKLKELKLEEEDVDLDTLNTVIDGLIDLGLLIEFDKQDIVNFLDNYGNLKIMRTGFGVGLDEGEATISVDGENISVNMVEYFAWQLATGNVTIKDSSWEYYKSVCMFMEKERGVVDEVDAKAYKPLTTVYAAAVLSLYNKGLVYIVA